MEPKEKPAEPVDPKPADPAEQSQADGEDDSDVGNGNPPKP